MNKIFIVEDDDNIRDMLIYALTSSGFEPQGFSNGEDLMTAFKDSLPALLILDIMLPGEDGIAILKSIKSSNSFSDLPVIMLTAKSAEFDRIMGLDLGADDYITKPFSVLEVISRVRAVLRRYKVNDVETNELQVGSIAINLDKRSVIVDGKEIQLTYTEFELLYFLMINKDIVLSRDKILEEVWNFDYNGESRTVDMHIKTLCSKIGEKSEIIRTVRNVGYTIKE